MTVLVDPSKGVEEALKLSKEALMKYPNEFHLQQVMYYTSRLNNLNKKQP